MAELHVTASASVSAPPAQVWDLLSDTSRYAEWVAGTDEVTRTDGTARAGSTYEELNTVLGPWKARSRWTVTEFDPPRRQAHRGEGLPFTSSFEVVMQVAPVGEAASEITLTLHGRSSAGPLGALFARLMAGQVESHNRTSVQNLAELAARELSGKAL